MIFLPPRLLRRATNVIHHTFARVREIATSHSRLVHSIFLSSTLPLVLYFLVMQYYGVPISKVMFLVDFFSLAYLSSLFFLFQNNNRLAIIPFVIIMSLIFWAAIQKYIILSIWIRFADLSLLDEAWQVLSPTHRLGLLSLSTFALGITLYNIRLPHLRDLGLLLIPVVLCGTLMFSFPGYVAGSLLKMSHAVYGNDPLYRSVLFAIGFDLLDRLQFERESNALLSRYSSRDASKLLSTEIQHKRNVHIFVMESFMDPTLLGIPLPQDPIDPRIRKNIGGSSLSPVFAGRSAQAEFELLCGTPVYDFLDPVTFNDLRGLAIACLPSLLQQNGYITLASHDVNRNFFNASVAYKSLGFSITYFRDAYPTVDMDGNWVSADQQIAFNKQHIQSLLESNQPFLNYVFFTTGHIPYEMNPDRRPLLIQTSSTNEVTRFINALYYNSRSVAQYIDFLLERDPEAILLVIGDHQGALPSINRTHSRQYAFDRFLTPYLFLDAGEARSFGDIAHYEVPNLILASLSGTPYLSVAQSYGVDMIRPFNLHAFYKYEGDEHLCPNANDPRCAAVDQFKNETIARWVRLIQQSHPDSE